VKQGSQAKDEKLVDNLDVEPPFQKKLVNIFHLFGHLALFKQMVHIFHLFRPLTPPFLQLVDLFHLFNF